MSTQQQGDGGIGTGLSVIAGVAILALVLWFTSADFLRMGVWKMLQVEAAAVGAIAPVLPRRTQARVSAWQARMVKPKPPEWTPVELFKALNYGGGYLRIPAFLLFGGLGYAVHRRGVARRYTKTHNFETLLVEQSRMHPRMRPVLWLKGREYDSDRGPYTWARTPWAWAVAQKVITPGEVAWATEQTFDADRAMSAFAAQVGARLAYKSDGTLDAAPLAFHEQILFAVFAARMMDRKNDSDSLLDVVAAGFGPDFSRAERVERLRKRTAKYDWPADTAYRIAIDRKADSLLDSVLGDAVKQTEIHRLVQTCRHVGPLLVLMMESAQAKYGILTTSDFIWLKAVDRTLHYTLNDVGRRVASTEAGGVRAYLIAHKALLDEIEGERRRDAEARAVASIAARADAAQAQNGLDSERSPRSESASSDVGAGTPEGEPIEASSAGTDEPIENEPAQAADGGDSSGLESEVEGAGTREVDPLAAASEAVNALKNALKESGWMPPDPPVRPS